MSLEAEIKKGHLVRGRFHYFPMVPGKVEFAVALRRLRQRFRELIDTELADTVASADELLAEQHALFAVLREHA